MSKPTYYELLRDPRWQRKRLEIMERDGFACLDCGAADKTLNVHHAYYEKGRDPWDYEPSALMTLCEECHDSRHAAQNSLLSLLPALGPFGICQLIGYAQGLVSRENALSMFQIPHESTARGIADAREMGVLGQKLIMAYAGNGRMTLEQLNRIDSKLPPRTERALSPEAQLLVKQMEAL